ncbi:hypothetical protein B0H66DRAFT_466211 [Apodospora peruviana]|uniref:Uncharacterized protein n=1 Tax=Apodospora peruviana TaxID=516989 RepID=A0AAE0ISS3_9PEZI|nr:hypothetical protein B0H66DRAFT_466211 [Apodospora peruviana]
MDASEPDPAFNLAELLAQDLENSAAVFTSKSMTAGYPTHGLATPDGYVDGSTHGPTISRYPTPQSQHPVTRPRHLQLNVVNEANGTCAMHDQEAVLSYGGDCSGSTSESESAVMEPLSIRTRQQSVTTPATSVSGRCSSLVSHKPVSPSSTLSSASFPHMARQGQGSWFDADEYSPLHSERHDSMERPSSPFRPRSALAFNSTTFDNMPPALPDGSLRITTSAAFQYPAFRDPNSIERPHTSGGVPQMERPRIINIPPSVIVPRRRSSLNREQGRLPLASSEAHMHDQTVDNAPDIPSEEKIGIDEGMPIVSTVPILTTSSGRVIIDASRPPSVDSIRDLLPRRAQAAPPSRLSIIRTETFDEGEPAEDYVCPERPAPTRRPWIGNIHGRFDSGMGHYAPGPSNIPRSKSLGGIPLPPEVIDSLRISLSCFPETMLLSSSLSIETVRAYSRKLRHQVCINPHDINHSEDNRSLFSFSGHSTKRQNRWNLQKLIPSHWAKQQHHQGHYRRSSNGSDLARDEPEAPAIASNWVPIKNIFPAGSDYLCDALYAHIVAYNYLNTLYPLPVAQSSRTTFPGSSDGSSGVVKSHQLGDNNHKVPKKAASVLGMQSSDAAPAHQYPDSMSSLGRIQSRRFRRHVHGTDWGLIRSASGGSNNSGGGVEMAVIRDLQAGLERCINQLVKTLEQESLSEQSEPVRPRDSTRGVDSFLLRALFEVVHVAEDSVC